MFRVVAKFTDESVGITEGKIYTIRKIRYSLGCHEFFFFNDNEIWKYTNANYFKENKEKC